MFAHYALLVILVPPSFPMTNAWLRCGGASKKVGRRSNPDRAAVAAFTGLICAFVPGLGVGWRSCRVSRCGLSWLGWEGLIRGGHRGGDPFAARAEPLPGRHPFLFL